MIKHTPQLVDAVEMAQQSPHTFHLPNLKGLKVGDIVKVCNGFERFWVILTEINIGNMCQGIVDNLLVFPCGYDLGDMLHFEKRNIYQVDREDKPETFYVRRSVRIARQQVKNSREFSGYVKMFEC